MSTPSRRPSPAVYRRRRLVVVVVALLVVAGVVALAIWQPWRGVATPAASASPTSSAVATSPAATPSPSEPSVPEEPAPSEPTAAPAIEACSTSNITVLAVTDQDSYGGGELPKLSITLSNDSDLPCLINVGTATQAFEISSGPDVWWRSTDCQAESNDQVVQLDAGQTVSSVTPLEWDRTRSSVDTCAAARPQAPAGYFHLSVSIGGIEAADTKAFELR